MTVLSCRPILRQPGRYVGWPTVTLTRQGELLVVFSGDRDRHICPFGKTQMIRSRDGGRRWSDVETINDGPLDDRDAGIIETARGTLLLTWFTSLAYAEDFDNRRQAYGDAVVNRWSAHLARNTDDYWFRCLGSWVRRSEDGGRTWGKPVRVMGSAPHGAVQLCDGRLLYVGRTLRAIYRREAILVQVSEDDGLTWDVTGVIPPPSPEWMRFLSEPHAVECEDGRIVVMIRCRVKAAHDTSFLHQSESLDGGRTWSVARPTAVWGYPPHLLRRRNGTLLLSFGHRREPFGERAVLSADGGRTWDVAGAFQLASAPNADLGYPTSVELEDGSLYTVFYQCERAGELPCLMAAHWRIED